MNSLETSTNTAGDRPIRPAFLGNIAFWVTNFEAMRHFYSELIGVPELAAGERPRRWVFYGDDAFTFSLNQGGAPAAEKGWARCPADPSLGEEWAPYVTLYVSDLAAAHERLRAAGAPLHHQEPFSLGEGFGWSIEAKDPDGNTVAITQR